MLTGGATIPLAHTSTPVGVEDLVTHLDEAGPLGAARLAADRGGAAGHRVRRLRAAAAAAARHDVGVHAGRAGRAAADRGPAARRPHGAHHAEPDGRPVRRLQPQPRAARRPAEDLRPGPPAAGRQRPASRRPGQRPARRKRLGSRRRGGEPADGRADRGAATVQPGPDSGGVPGGVVGGADGRARRRHRAPGARAQRVRPPAVHEGLRGHARGGRATRSRTRR